MTLKVNEPEVEFTEAANTWNLEKLYIDLASAKGRGLTPVEKKILRGLLCGYSPGEITNQVYKSRSSSSVRVYLSNGLYKYIQEMLLVQTGEIIKIKNWSHITNLLSKAGYQIAASPQFKLSETLPQPNQTEENTLPLLPTNLNSTVSKSHDWEKAIDVGVFYGRAEDLSQLEQWIIKENCRLVALLGMGGIGKTALAAKLVEQIQDQFEYVIWRSLRHAPSIEDILVDLIQLVFQGQQIELPATVEGRIGRLLSYLRSHRCLLVLDNAEAILRHGNAGYYREGYEGYGELLRRVGEESHRSCLVLTSREKPKEIAFLQGEKLPVHSLELSGLKTPAGQELLGVKGLVGSFEERRALIKRYGGNPLALKIVATTIQDVFNSEIANFLEKGTLVFGDIRELLDQQFNRLSKLEKKVIYWLVINHKLVPLRGFKDEVIPGLSQQERLEVFESLRRRSLIEKHSTSFALPPVFRMYIIEKLGEQVCEEMASKEIALLVSQTLRNAQVKDILSSLTPSSKGTSKALD